MSWRSNSPGSLILRSSAISAVSRDSGSSGMTVNRLTLWRSVLLSSRVSWQPSGYHWYSVRESSEIPRVELTVRTSRGTRRPSYCS
ncbi:Uncharacterised protein [Mycobacteroides abscessus subsp. abscessus]|nr:Uncharacterised protein [Mycobacteroides abscessus subsp. abscessus]